MAKEAPPPGIRQRSNNHQIKLGYVLPSLVLFMFGFVVYAATASTWPFPNPGLAFAGVGILNLIGTAVWMLLDYSFRRSRPGGGAITMKRQLAIGCYLVSGSVAVVEGLTYLAFVLQPFASIFTREGSAFLSFQIYHLLLHYGFSASLAIGFGVAMIAIAVGPVRTGLPWGKPIALAIGLFPAVGIVVVTTIQLLSWASFLVVPSMRLNEIHLYELSIPTFWVAGLVLT